MKIGLSYSRCVRDIVQGRVDIDDVLVLISRTDFDPHDDEQWSEIWKGYRYGLYPEWWDCGDRDEDHYRQVSRDLWDSGRLHQPRKFGYKPRRHSYHWLEAVLPSEELDANPTVKDAWEKFQMVAGLTNVKLDRTYSWL
jgi:hypothetical protein